MMMLNIRCILRINGRDLLQLFELYIKIGNVWCEMKRLLFGFALLIMITGCQQSNNTNIESLSINEITTYEESIEDGKVEIDGISYDIQSVVKISNTYDANGNVIEKVSKNDNSETRIEFLYKNNQIIEEKR